MNRSINSRLLALAAIGSALAVAACGSAANTGTNSANADQALEYVRCLRLHGVSNFPDPSPGGRLPNIPSDIDTKAPAFQAAQHACANVMPAGGASGTTSGSWMPRLLAVARCMRNHGLPNFPDPTTSPPPPPPPNRHTGNVEGGPGAYLAFPPSSPRLTRAAAACGLPPP